MHGGASEPSLEVKIVLEKKIALEGKIVLEEKIVAWIKTVADDEASGQLGKFYDGAKARAGRVYGIVRLMSLDPTILQASMGLYAATTTGPRSPLSRWFRELIAVRVSRANDCFY